jgi:hypothetical protein
VAAEDDGRLDVELRRTQPQEGVHAQTLVAGAEDGGRPECVPASQNSLLGPPERDLTPPPLHPDRQELERPNTLTGDEVVPHPQPGRDCAAVAVVAVEQLNDTHDVFELGDERAVEWIDQPRALVGHDGVRAALQELFLDPFL